MTTCRNACRLLALVGAGVFGLLTLVGCGGGGGDGGGSTPAPTAKAWGTAQLIEAETFFGALRPQIAVDGSGNAIAVWYQQDGGIFRIWANRFSAGAWGTAQLIETDNTATMLGASDPQIAMDGSGNAVAVWYQFDDTRNNIWANRFSAGAWGTAVMIETDTGNALSPQIAVDGSGNAIAVWEQFDGMNNNIWANRFSAGAWGAAQLIEFNPGNADEPKIAVDGSGNFIAVWSQANDVWANRFVAGTGWGTAELIETSTLGAIEPQIAVDGSGNALAVWREHDGGMRFNIWANRFVAGSGWGMAQLIETDDAGTALAPQIAVDGSGNAIAVWQQSDGTRDNIWANRFSAGAWGTAQLIETDNAGSASSSQIAADGSGNAIAVWQQSDGTRDNIWANRFSAGAWGTAQLIETDNAGSALFPQIAVNASGNAIAVWQQLAGMLENVWANRFE